MKYRVLKHIVGPTEGYEAGKIVDEGIFYNGARDGDKNLKPNDDYDRAADLVEKGFIEPVEDDQAPAAPTGNAKALRAQLDQKASEASALQAQIDEQKRLLANLTPQEVEELKKRNAAQN